MTDNDNRGKGGEAPSGSFAKDSRQDRLRLALRENLKRRKSQARERGRGDAPTSEAIGPALDETGEKDRER
jgi:hypothetical protein